MENAPQSQVEVTCKLVEIAAQMPDVRTPADLGLLRDALLAHLTFRSYNKTSWEHERSIRWKRTATEILSDGWVYEAKGCTDIVIAFIGLCRAKGLATRFIQGEERYWQTAFTCRSLSQWRLVAGGNSRTGNGSNRRRDERRDTV